MSHTPGQYEKSDAYVSPIVYWLLALIAILLVSLLFSAGYHHFMLAGVKFMDRDVHVSPMAQMHRIPPEPRLQVDDSKDMAHFRELEDAVLHHYAWIDSREDKVRLPVERAMELIAERGLPSRRSHE